MTKLSPKLTTAILLVISLGLIACQEKPAHKPVPTEPSTLNPGMRAYVDPVTGNYAPAPPQAQAAEQASPRSEEHTSELQSH